MKSVVRRGIDWMTVAGLLLTLHGAPGRLEASVDADMTAPTEENYWPLALGATWVYVDQDQRQETFAVIGREMLDGRSVAVVEHRDASAAVDRRLYYFTQEDGEVSQVATQEIRNGQAAAITRLDLPRIVWPARAAPGVRWPVWVKGATGTRTSEMVIARAESVTVPAGTYAALVAVNETSAGRVTTNWVAPGVGLVRTITTGPPTQHSLTFSLTLIRYTLPSPSTVAVRGDASDEDGAPR